MEAQIRFCVTRRARSLLLGALALIAGELGSAEIAGSLDATTPVATLIFVFALVGCGIKAGMMPGHIWLPGAHGNAPSHVSALMSGVLIKMGIYALLRLTSVGGA